MKHGPLPRGRKDIMGGNSQTRKKHDGLIALGLAAAALAIYVTTLAPGLLESDSAELQTLAATLGYAHPTGYPVYLLSAHAATWLPLGEIAYRVNLWSALCAAAAVGLLYVLVRVLIGYRGPAVAAAVALAVSPTFWSQAIIARVYAMGLLVMIAVLLCLVLWRQRGHAAWLFAAACLGGVSIGVHSTHSLMAPAALLLVARSGQRWPQKWPAAIGGAVAGIAVTLGAFWVIDRADSRASYFRAVISPSQSQWNLGERAPCTHGRLDSFWGRVDLCLRPPQFTGLVGRKPMSEFWAKLRWYGENLPREFPWPWLVLAVVGVPWLWRREDGITLLLLLTFLTHLGFDLVYDMGGVQVLYLATYVPIAVFGAAGLWSAGVHSRFIWSAGIHSRFWPSKQPPTSHVGFASPKSGNELPHSKESGNESPHSILAILAVAVVLSPLLWPSSWTCEGRRECLVPPGEDPFRVLYAPTCKQPIERLSSRSAGIGSRSGTRRGLVYRLDVALSGLLRGPYRDGAKRSDLCPGLSAGRLLRVGRLGRRVCEGDGGDRPSGLLHARCSQDCREIRTTGSPPRPRHALPPGAAEIVGWAKVARVMVGLRKPGNRGFMVNRGITMCRNRRPTRISVCWSHPTVSQRIKQRHGGPANQATVASCQPWNNGMPRPPAHQNLGLLVPPYTSIKN